MKKVISLVFTFVLAAGLGFGVSFYNADIRAESIDSTPEYGATVPLLGGNVLEFCTHYKKGASNEYYTRYKSDYPPRALKIEWDKVEDADSYSVKIGMKEDLSDAKQFVTPETKQLVEDLYAATDYYYQITTEVHGNLYSTDIIKITTADLPRTIYVDSVDNTRDFGGRLTVDKKYRVKQGIIYRGQNVDKASDEGKDKLVNFYGIKTDLDLRGESKVSPLGTNIKCIAVNGVMYSSALEFEHNWPSLRKEIMAFVDPNNYPIYVHCAIGRDRTGTLMYLIGALAGMSESDLCRDYELSFFANCSNSDVKDTNKFNKSNLYSIVKFLNNYDKGNLQQNTMEFMRERLKIQQSDLNKIRSNILTPGATPIPEPKVPAPAKVKLKKVKNVKKKAISVKFKKAKNAKGYEINWSTSKKFIPLKSKTKSKYITKTSFKIKKLKKKKKYYVRVRAYNINGHMKVFGPYSKVKKIKIKK